MVGAREMKRRPSSLVVDSPRKDRVWTSRNPKSSLRKETTVYTFSRRSLNAVILLALSFFLWPAPRAHAQCMFTNGDFETGDLSGWTVYNRAFNLGDWYNYTGTTGPLSGHFINAPPQGSRAATTDQNQATTHVLYQDFTLPAGQSGTLSFYLAYNNTHNAFINLNTLDYVGNQQFRIDLIKPTAGNESIAVTDVWSKFFQTKPGDPIDTPEYFVRQHYLDFLGREPDESGFNFWSDQILSCGGDADCRERRRINVSAAYFLSIEFQHTGGLVDGLYRASYGRRPLYAEFMPDTRVVARDVIVGRENWAQQWEANKRAFVDAGVQRAAFRALYDGLGNDAFVDTLINFSGSGFNGDRNALVNGLNSGIMTRAAVLRQVVENEGFARAKSNQMFVMMEYFGYLRRDPDDGGYQFWLNKLNQFGGNFEEAEMVKAFIVSGEYRGRFR